MARIHIILQGFVDINLETDENVNTHITGSNVISSNEEENQIDSSIGALIIE